MDIDCLILRIIVYYGFYIEVEELSAHCIKFRKREKYQKKDVVLGLNLDNNNFRYLLIHLANNSNLP